MSDHVAGRHAVHACLVSGFVSQLLVEEQGRGLEEFIVLAQQKKIHIKNVSRRELDRQSQGAPHQGVMALLLPYPYATLESVLALNADLILVLDQIQDPRNLGAIIRSAAAFGVGAIICPKDNSSPVSGVVHETSSGLTAKVPIARVANLCRALAALKERGFWIYGADGDSACDLPKTRLNSPCVIVMGGEGDGMRRLTREMCDVVFKIPMAPHVESLNVSVASAIVLYEFRRT